jgi:mono/diheme cytochrome c family protein
MFMRNLPSVACILLAAAFLAAGFHAAQARGEGQDPQEWKAPARAARKKNPIKADEASIAAGRKVYVAQCLSCHGEKGHGDGPASKDLTPKPRDLATPAIAAQTDGAIFWKLTEGRKPMPSFEKLISEDERWQVINFIRTYSSGTNGSTPRK